jgi:hypothetical protein
MSGDLGGAMTDLIRVPYADHMLVPLPVDVRAVDAASAGVNLVDAYRCVAPGLVTQPGIPVLIMAGGGGAPSISLYVGLHGTDDPTLATLPFLVATGAPGQGIDCCVVLVGEGAILAKAGFMNSVNGVGFPPLAELWEKVKEFKIPVYV